MDITDCIVKQLRDYAEWTREAQDETSDPLQRISIDDMDADLLDKAADEIERLRRKVRELSLAEMSAVDGEML